jgi:hypothetical protein
MELGGALRIGPKKDKNDLFKKAYDEALDKNTYEIRFCELIIAFPAHQPTKEYRSAGKGCHRAVSSA